MGQTDGQDGPNEFERARKRAYKARNPAQRGGALPNVVSKQFIVVLPKEIC